MSDTLTDLQHDIAHSDAPAEAFHALPAAQQRDVFFHLPDSLRESIVVDLAPEQVRQFVRRLDPDEGTDVLGLLDDDMREQVLQTLSEERRKKLEFLLEFSSESAAGLMDLDYVTVDKSRSLGSIAQRVRRHEERTGRFPTIFVTDDNAFLGELP
ncbi:MAG: magnesium transporter MgtE N-terminal domain-containing protein, partial [Salinivenus sp.]